MTLPRLRSFTWTETLPQIPRDAGRRLLNVVIAMVILVLALPLMVIIAVLIKLTSRGPVLFTQWRVGLDRRDLSSAGGNLRRHADYGGRKIAG